MPFVPWISFPISQHRLDGWMLIAAFMVIAASRVTAAEPESTVATSPASAHVPAPLELAPESVVTRNVAYADDDDKSGHMLDIYAPRDAKALPVLLFVHGGGWNHGDKSEVGSQPKFFNEHDLVFISINYRLSPPHQHPAHVDDLASAIGWTRKNIDRYGGDGQNIIIMGHSAGSHLVALVATNSDVLAKQGLKPTDLRGTISLDGSAFDIVDRIAKGSEKLAENCRRAFGSDPEVQRDASPLQHAANGANIAPFLLMYVKEGSLNHAQSKAFGDKLNASGGQAELLPIEGKDHFSLLNDLGTERDAAGNEILRFVRTVTASPQD